MREDKTTARREAQRILDEAGEEYLRACDAACAESFFTLPEYGRARNIFCYWGAGREPDTGAIIKRAIKDGKTVALPRVLGEGIMEARVIDGVSQLLPGTFGIPEPSKECRLMKPEDIDIVLVPAACFSRDGHRLGRGGGYYDRFLPRIQGLKVGIARERLLADELPLEPHDMPVDCLITEKKITRPR